MRWAWRRNRREPLPSERGLLEFVGRDAGLPLRDVFLRFRDLVDADMDWADSRKTRFRARATVIKVFVLLLTASSTIVLGIPAFPNRAAIALPMVASVTLLSALETYFNWRSRWVLMEETQYRLNRLRDEVDFYLVSTPLSEVSRARLDVFFKDQQTIWSDVSRRWVEFRKLDPARQDESPLAVRQVSPE